MIIKQKDCLINKDCDNNKTSPKLGKNSISHYKILIHFEIWSLLIFSLPEICVLVVFI